jgi:hypothetical protein
VDILFIIYYKVIIVMSSKKQESFTEMMIKYAKTIPDDTEISMRLFELYKDTIYDRVYNIIKTIFRLNLNQSLPYNFFKTLSIDSISKTTKLAPLIPAFNYKGDPGHYLEQVKHFVAFCVYCESNFSRNTTTESFNILRSSEPPECVSLLIYHGGSADVSEELKQAVPSAKDRYFLIAPPTRELFWDIGLEPLITSVYSNGLNKPEQRKILSNSYLDFNKELKTLETDIKDEIEFFGNDTPEYQKYLELCQLKQEKTFELSVESKNYALRELKFNCIEAYKESFEGSHPEDGTKYPVGFYLLPKLPNTAITVELPIIHFLNMYIELKINSDDDDKDQLIMCLPKFNFRITSDNYSTFIENCMRKFNNRFIPIKIEKGYGNKYGTWMYEYFNYFVFTFGGEELKRYFFALFGCGRSAIPNHDDRYIDDYIISVKFLLDLIKHFCGPTIILDGSCNEPTENYEGAFENSQPLDSTSSQGGIPDTRPGGRPGGGTRKKNKKLKKTKKKNKKTKSKKEQKIQKK